MREGASQPKKLKLSKETLCRLDTSSPGIFTVLPPPTSLNSDCFTCPTTPDPFA